MPLDAVVWIEAGDYCVKIHNSNGQSHTIRSSIKSLESRLPTRDYIRTHRKANVNLNAVEVWLLPEEQSAILINGLYLPIAQSRINTSKINLIWQKCLHN